MKTRKEVIRSSLYLADQIDAKAMIVFTKSGFMGKTTAALRPNMPVYTFTFSDETVKNLSPYYGIRPILIEQNDNTKNLENAKKYLLKNFLIKTGDTVVVLIDGDANAQ